MEQKTISELNHTELSQIYGGHGSLFYIDDILLVLASFLLKSNPKSQKAIKHLSKAH